jgi:hypothetical protein
MNIIKLQSLCISASPTAKEPCKLSPSILLADVTRLISSSLNSENLVGLGFISSTVF